MSDVNRPDIHSGQAASTAEAGSLRVIADRSGMAAEADDPGAGGAVVLRSGSGGGVMAKTLSVDEFERVTYVSDYSRTVTMVNSGEGERS